MLKFLLLPLILISCARESGQNIEAIGSTTAGQGAAVFLNTHLHSEEDLARLAGDLLKKGYGISSSAAEKCLTDEINRPRVQLICGFLWSIEGGESRSASEYVLKNAVTSREWAIAALIRKTGLESISPADFLTILKNAKSEALPLLLKAVEFRSVNRTQMDSNEKKSLLHFLSSLNPDNGDFLPMLSVLWRLDRVAYLQLLNSRCNSDLLGTARITCWKSIVPFRNFDLPEEIRFALKSRLPDSWLDPDWKQFRKHFPKTAAKIQKMGVL